MAPQHLTNEGLAKAFYAEGAGPEVAQEVLARGEEVLWNWPNLVADAADALALGGA